ncbi:MAG: hypothetical protein R3C26_09775 [Calditrichia bacterium]
MKKMLTVLSIAVFLGNMLWAQERDVRRDQHVQATKWEISNLNSDILDGCELQFVGLKQRFTHLREQFQMGVQPPHLLLITMVLRHKPNRISICGGYMVIYFSI